MSEGFLLLVAGPSGAGKSSVVRPIVDADPLLQFSISCTTRSPRAGEVDGQDYHFLNPAEFERQRDAGAFVEWAAVHEHLYGTRYADLEGMLAAGRIPVLDIDVQGGEQLRARYPSQVLSVFLRAPDDAELERRLRGRGTESEESIAVRLANARREEARAAEYQHQIVNDEVPRAQDELREILAAERAKRGI